MTTTKMIKEKAKFFFDKITFIHIKTNSAFYNGYIKDINESFLILEDRLFGEIPINFSEIYRIEPYKELGEKE